VEIWESRNLAEHGDKNNDGDKKCEKAIQEALWLKDKVIEIKKLPIPEKYARKIGEGSTG
jgi:hypothetical protein